MPDADVVALAAPAGDQESSAPLRMDLAPIAAGKKFGPCLLYARAGNPSNYGNQAGWFLGSWDGAKWYALGSGFFVTPIAWCPLPKTPTW